MREKLGPEHPDTLTCTSNLAAVYRALGQFDQAVPLLEAVVKRQAATLGRQHPDTLRSLANLGANYLAIGRRNEALPLLEEAFRAHPQYPELRWVGEPLLDGYLLAGETAKGVALVRARIASGRPLVPKDSPRLAAGLAQEGQALLKLRAWADAESVLRECLALREKLATDPKSGVVPWQVANARSLLGGALLGQGKHAEAEPLLIQGCEGLKAQERTIPPQGRANLPAALARLVRLYEATDCPQAAAPYRAELARRLTAELHRDLAWPLLWGWPRP
jgi:serine/threonine-protein kinase